MLIYLQMIESNEDRSKFEQLYILYRGLMLYVAKGILRNQEDAEDAVHQAFVSIIENLRSITDINSPKTRSFSEYAALFFSSRPLTALSIGNHAFAFHSFNRSSSSDNKSMLFIISTDCLKE